MVRLFFCRFADNLKLFILNSKGVKTMKEEKYYLFLNNDEIKIVVWSLIMLRNNLLKQNRYTDCVDELIIKITQAKTNSILCGKQKPPAQ